ncbi:transposable element Tcb1 transposase [Trichonephila clavipes]|nr:transposable element Tcb1 transposase [Trichonephila clavipes]
MVLAEVRYANDKHFSADTHVTSACGTTSKRCLRLGDFDDFKFRNCFFLVVFSKNDQLCLVENSNSIRVRSSIRVRQRKDSNLPRYCGLSFRKIDSRVGRNQTTVMQICDRWMQESTTDRRGRSHPPQSTTSREDRKIVRKAVTDRSVTSRTVAQHIESVPHHSVSVRVIRRLKQSGLSARRPFLELPLMQNHRRLHRQWCDERRMWAT